MPEIRLVIPATLEQHGITGDPAALQRLIDDAYQEIEARCGSFGKEIVEYYTSFVPRKQIFTMRKIGQINAVAHGSSFKTSLMTTLVADADDGYQLTADRLSIIRLGGNFYTHVTIAYLPIDETARRDRVVIELVKLSLGQTVIGGGGSTGTVAGNVTAESVGDLSVSYGSGSGGASSSPTRQDYTTERDRLISSLLLGRRPLA